jgi:hypothetical protein
MFHQPLQFQLASDERKLTVVFPDQILCLRQTAGALEFLRGFENGTTDVIVAEGTNPGVLRREIIHGVRIMIAGGSCGPAWSRCKVARIYRRLEWTIPKERLAPDPNPAPDFYLQMETGLTRDLWPRSRLETFAVPRNPKDEQFLLQFHQRHAYALKAFPGTFSSLLAEFKRTNFHYDMINRFTVFPGNPYPPLPGIDLRRLAFQSIDYRPSNLAQESRWEVILDFKERAGPSPAVAVSIA